MAWVSGNDNLVYLIAIGLIVEQAVWWWGIVGALNGYW
jgi:hypothetical protein